MININTKTAIIVGFAMHSSLGHATEWGLLSEDIFENQASITSSSEYNSNPTLSPSSSQGVFQETFTPRYKFSNLNDNQALYFDFQLMVVRSSQKEIVIDRENPNATLGYTHAYEKGAVTASTNYSESSSRTAELTQSGVVGADLTSVARSYNLSWNHELTELFSLSSNASYSNTNFSGGSSSLVSNRSRQLSSSLSYQLTETLSPVFQVTYVKQYAGNVDPTSSMNYSAGIDWQYTEDCKLGFRYGKNRTFGSTSANGWTGSLNASYSASDDITFSAELSRQVSPSNLGGMNASDRANAAMSYQINELSSIMLTYSETKNKTVNQTQLMLFSTSYSRTISDHLTLSVNASYRELENPNSNASSKVLGFTLSYDHPAF